MAGMEEDDRIFPAEIHAYRPAGWQPGQLIGRLFICTFPHCTFTTDAWPNYEVHYEEEHEDPLQEGGGDEVQAAIEDPFDDVADTDFSQFGGAVFSLKYTIFQNTSVGYSHRFSDNFIKIAHAIDSVYEPLVELKRQLVGIYDGANIRFILNVTLLHIESGRDKTKDFYTPYSRHTQNSLGIIKGQILNATNYLICSLNIWGEAGKPIYFN